MAKRGTIAAAGYLLGVGLIGFVLGLWAADDKNTVANIISSYQPLIASLVAFLTAGAAAVLGYFKLDSDETAHRDKLAAEAEAHRAKLERTGVAMVARIAAIGRRFSATAEILQAQPNLEAMRATIDNLVVHVFPRALEECDEVISSSWAKMGDVDVRTVNGLSLLLTQLSVMALDARSILADVSALGAGPVPPIVARGLDFQCWRILDDMLEIEPHTAEKIRPPARPENRAAFEASRGRTRES
jgi:hypothetical protein